MEYNHVITSGICNNSIVYGPLAYQLWVVSTIVMEPDGFETDWPAVKQFNSLTTISANNRSSTYIPVHLKVIYSIMLVSSMYWDTSKYVHSQSNGYL